MHNLSQRYGKLLSIGLSVICSVFLVAVIVSAATTIGANVSTVNVTGTGDLAITGNSALTGTLGVTGKTTMTNASSTYLSSFNWLGVGATATTTINSAGNLAVAGTASVAGVFTPTGGISTSTINNMTIGASTASTGAFTTLSASGLSSMSSVSSTALSAWGGLQVGRTATTTIHGSTTSTFSSSVILDEAGANTSTLQVGHTSASKGQGGCIAVAADNGTVVYLMMVAFADHYELTTSTLARDCGY